MDSINKNQPEQNHQDLSGADAVKKIKELIEKANTCFFVTATTLFGAAKTRPMSVQQVDDAGNIWFLSAVDSHKNEELTADSSVKLYFQVSTHAGFLVVDGNASITRDKATIQKLWEPIAKVWFTEGIDDPRISVIKVTPHGGYYWDTKHGSAVAGIKMMIGAAIGKTLDDSIEGNLSLP